MTDVEFSRPFDVSRFEDGDSDYLTIVAEAEERDVLAVRFDLAALPSLKADVTIVRSGRQVVAGAVMHADVVQTCVVSLDLIEIAVDERFEVVFDPDVRPTGEFDETIDFNLGADEPPEPLVNDAIDLGEMVAEHFGLALAPYPRKPGAEIDPRYTSDEVEERKSPFAVLKGLKQDG
ncbi:MAG: DUF177 domain-containing protein [Rhodospirillales bacterium]|nr:DUF177 domain-containing protein [Rhodospirillales bacterium]